MSLSISFTKEPKKSVVNFVVPLFKGESFAAPGLSNAAVSFVKHALEKKADFKAGHGEVLDLLMPADADEERVIVLGLGDAKALTAVKAEEAGGKLLACLNGSGLKDVSLLLSVKAKGLELKEEELGACLANGAVLRSYKFERYKSKPSGKGKKLAEEKKVEFSKLAIVHEHSANVKKAYDVKKAISEGVFFARDLVNSAPNDLYPESYAQIIKDELKPLGVEVEVLDEKKMLKLGMGAIMAVGQGSARQPRMVVMRWKGAAKKAQEGGPLAFVGKGVTFDTGGISLKPGAGMDEMKMDMGGSAAVVGLMKSLALRKAKVDVVGVVGLAENMPSERAYRPGDVVTSYSGKTIEVLNTDAEGRLVLADCLTHVQKKYKPRFIIDLATLTGAIMVALGYEYCGTFATDDEMWSQLEKASASSGEKLWRMPLDEEWKKQMQSDVADLQNIGKIARMAGSCTAAGFLQHFIEDDTPWVHMDIAGTAWRKSDMALYPKFGSGFGVRVLSDFVMSNYEG